MRCDEVLTRAADLDEACDVEVEHHVAACADCREALDAAREMRDVLATQEDADSLRAAPAVDVDALWASRRTRRPLRVVRRLAQAAVVLLAVTGGLALAGVDLRPRAPSLTRADVDASVDAAVARLGARLDERDRARQAEMHDAAEWLDERRAADVAALVGEMAQLRRELAAVRMVQGSMTAAAMPALPDPR
jgi:hypothetical protein